MNPRLHDGVARRGGGLQGLVCTLWLALGLSAAGSEPDSSAADPRWNHWSFQPVTRPDIPTVRDDRWVRHPIDAFILSRLEAQSMTPSPEADRVTLIRRLSFDLTGLPPEPGAVRAFVSDTSPGAYEALVDALLDSPHHGEQWGRHWLDLARYADSDGYEKDTARPNAWRYRDWVIGAINADMPFDRFTLEQLAGDLLEGATVGQKVATGFHRNTLTNKEGGVDAEEFRCKAVVDRVSTTASVWLGLTLGCAECHTHKYDPITQREFFEMYAFFNQADEKDIAAPTDLEWARHEAAVRDWDAARPRGESAGQEAIAAHAKSKPPVPGTKAQTLAVAAERRATRIHERGDFLRPGEEVRPGTPKVLPALKARGAEADRLDLARWLVDPAHPLTARVAVNRIWGQLFGRGLVVSADDFGMRGERPTHPELLDWLAAEWVRLGWSSKAMIKAMVSSAAYRQASHEREAMAEADPLNAWVGRQSRFRLLAENVRDAALASGGLLSREIGGPSVRPPMPADIAALGYANSVTWKESAGADRYRRGLYIHFQRTVPYPMLMTFDAPDSNATCSRRERSNTPIQALTLWNDPVFVEAARALGLGVAREGAAPAASRIERAFERCLARRPTRRELDRLTRLHGEHVRLLEGASGGAWEMTGLSPGEGAPGEGTIEDAAALVAVCRVLMNLDEFVTRE